VIPAWKALPGPDGLARKNEPQISPLRFAPVEMTNLFGAQDFAA
jgi:hypothetical protein